MDSPFTISIIIYIKTYISLIAPLRSPLIYITDNSYVHRPLVVKIIYFNKQRFQGFQYKSRIFDTGKLEFICYVNTMTTSFTLAQLSSDDLLVS